MEVSRLIEFVAHRSERAVFLRTENSAKMCQYIFFNLAQITRTISILKAYKLHPFEVKLYLDLY